jgi:hypothetical protein
MTHFARRSGENVGITKMTASLIRRGDIKARRFCKGGAVDDHGSRCGLGY